MGNIIAIIVIGTIISGAIGYIVKAKKNGVHCIGCPSGGSCGCHTGGTCNCEEGSTCSCGEH